MTDPYVAHHAAWDRPPRVHLDGLDELDRAGGALAALPGVEAVLDRFAAADAFDLPSARWIGDVIGSPNASTVLGSRLPRTTSGVEWPRAHGGVHSGRCR